MGRTASKRMCDKQRRNAVLHGPNLLKEEQTTQVRGKKKVSSLVSGVENSATGAKSAGMGNAALKSDNTGPVISDCPG